MSHHPTAVIHPQAQVDSSVSIGPYAVIDAGVIVGAHCIIGPHVHLTGQTRIGSHNTFHAGCVIGDAPQDLKYRSAPTRVVIGDHNAIREHVTIHRSTTEEGITQVGSHTLLMAHSHVGHNARIDDHVILANGALVGGHVHIHERAFISGNCLLHQFVRVGRLALMQGGAAISKDLPPYTIARGDNGVCGLNIIGLRRAGFLPAERLELKRLYHLLFRSTLPWKQRIAQARSAVQSERGKVFVDFASSTQRGLCRDHGSKGSTDSEAD